METSIPQKRCSRCKQIYSLDSFNKNKSNPDGRGEICRECARAIQLDRRNKLKNSPIEGSKVCPGCKEQKPSTSFYAYYSYCKECAKATRQKYYTNKLKNSDKEKERIKKARLRRSYGLTLEEYEAMVIQQKGVCAICGNAPKSGHILFIDHNHRTGAIRSLLCTHCNSMLGHAHDNPDVLQQAIRYLEKHQ